MEALARLVLAYPLLSGAAALALLSLAWILFSLRPFLPSDCPPAQGYVPFFGHSFAVSKNMPRLYDWLT